MRFAPIALFVSLALAMSACGGGNAVSYPPTGSATASGNLRGDSLTPTDAISGTMTGTTHGTTSSVGAVLITNETGICGEVLAGKATKNRFALIIALAETSSSGGAIAPKGPGTFTVV